MKKIFALVLLLLITRYSFSQGYPISQNLGSDSTIVVSKGALQSRLVPIVITDTNAANAQRLKSYPGAQLYTTAGDFYIRNSNATKWILVSSGSSGSVNIYTADGTLTGNRTLTGASNNLTFTGLNKFTVSTADTTAFNTDVFNIKGIGGVLNVEGTAAGTTSSLTLKTASDGNWTISTGQVNFNSGDLRFYDNDNGANRMIIKPSGNVGIGTETPDSLLTVNGGVYVGGGIRAPGLPTALGTKALRINAQGQISVADTTLGGGTVISVGTNNGSGITGGPITVSGTLAIDTTNVIATKASVTGGLAGKLNISDTASMLSPYLRKADTTAMLAPYLRAIDTASLSNRINLKLNISDTASMLGNYLNNVGYGLSKVGQVASADSATLSAYYLRRKDSLTTTNPLGYVTKKILADTAAAIRSSDAGGTVTSVATNNGTGITGGTITTSGTIAADTLLLSTRAWRQKGVDSVAALINNNISGTTNYIPRFSSANAIDNSIMRESGSRIGINTSPFYNLDILEAGSATIGAGTTNNKIVLNGDDNGGSISTTNTTYISFAPFQTEAMRITSSGVVNMGANFTNNSNKLNVGGSATIGYSTNVVGPTNGLSVNGSVGIGLNGVNTDSALSVLNGAYFQRGVRMSGLPSAPGTKALRIDAAGTISIADTLIDAGGTVTSVATNNGTGITGGTITTSGTLAIDTTVISTRAWRQKGIDSVASLITGSYVPLSRTLTINGTSFDLSADRTWNVGTVTTAAASGGGQVAFFNGSTVLTSISTLYFDGVNKLAIGSSSPDSMLSVTQGAHIQRGVRLSGLPTAPGTRSLRIDANGTLSVSDTLANGMSGSGTPNYIPKFTGSNSIGNSVIYESSSNIGIGTISPNYPLHINSTSNARIGVQGTTNFSAFQNINSSGSVYWGIDDNAGANFTGTAYGRFIYSSGAYPLIFFTNSTERMRLDASGNLGLGVTPSAWSSLWSAQQVGQAGALFAYKSGSNYTVLTNNSYTIGGAYQTGDAQYINTGFSTAYIQNNSGQHLWMTAPSGTAGNAITFTQAMTLTASGNLGIGTTSPGQKLVVQESGDVFLQLRNNTAGQNFFIGALSTETRINNDNTTPTTFWNNGSERMRLDASGNLGLGVTPSAWETTASKAIQLNGGSLWGYSTSQMNLLQNAFYNTSGDIAYVNSASASAYRQISGVHSWYTAPSGTAGNAISFTQAMTLDASGNLGIGTTSPSGIGIVLNLYGGSSINSNLVLEGNSGNSFLSILSSATNGVPPSFISKDGFRFAYASDKSATGFAEHLRITSGGNVGIGTTSPSNILHLYKASEPEIYLQSSGATFRTGLNSDNEYFVYTANAKAIYFANNGSERMRITSGGNVGIGTTSPASLLVVSKSSNSGSGSTFPRIQVENTLATQGDGSSTFNFADIRIASGNGAAEMYLTSSYASGTWEPQGLINVATNHPMIFRTNNTERMRITSGGEVYIAGTTDQGAYNLQVNGTGVWGAGAYVDGSDSAVKKNIQPLGSSLDLIKQMNPVTFEYQPFYSKDTTTQTGFIAQELQQVLSDKVYKNGIVKEGGQYLGVAYQHLIPLLVKAIQEQQTQIDQLKSQLNNR